MTSKGTDGANKEHKFKTIVLLSFTATSDESKSTICLYGIPVDGVNGLKTKKIWKYIGTGDKRLSKYEVLWQPRVLHKLLLPLNSGLRHDTEQDNYFDEFSANAVMRFVGHMQQPACLVAHNGYDSHFPLLKQALNNFKLNLPSGILCVDSLPIILRLNARLKSVANVKVLNLKLIHEVIKNSCKDKPTDLLDLIVAIVGKEIFQSDNHALQASNGAIPKRRTEAGVKQQHSFDLSDSTPSKSNGNAIQKLNEATPDRRNEAGVKQQHSFDLSVSTPSKSNGNAIQKLNEATPDRRNEADVKQQHSFDLSDSTPSKSNGNAIQILNETNPDRRTEAGVKQQHSFDLSDSTPSKSNGNAIQKLNETTPDRRTEAGVKQQHSLHPSDSTPSKSNGNAIQKLNETTPDRRTEAGVKQQHSFDLSDSTPSKSNGSDIQILNEATPDRRTEAGVKQQHSLHPSDSPPSKSSDIGARVKRVLFPIEKQAVYKSQNEKFKEIGYFYAKLFNKQPKQIHCAEENVKSLMTLITIYGKHFLDNAEMHAFSFEDVLINTQKTET